MSNRHGNISVNTRPVIAKNVLNYREAKEIKSIKKVLYGNKSSKKQYLKVPAPLREQNKPRQMG